MIRTPICDLLDVEHPIALGGMGSATSPALVAAVSRAGGLGALGCHYLTPDQIRERTAAIRQDTNKPFGLNFLTFDTREDSFAAALELRPSVMQFAWARPDQDLKPYFDRAHDAGCKVTYMAGAVPEALRAAEGRRRHHHCAGHRGRRSCWLDGQHAAHPNGRRCGRADSGPRRWGLCRRPRPDRRVGARRWKESCLALVSWQRWSRRFTSTSSKRSWTATATIRNCRKFPISRRAWCGRAP